MPTIRVTQKESKETGELYQAWVMNPDETKNYSDFRYVNDCCGKMAEFFESKYPEEWQEYLNNGQNDVDFADFVTSFI